MLKIAVIDDHALFRQGLRALLAPQSDFVVVAEAFDASSAYKLVDETRPDVVLLDIALPGASGLTIARELLRRQPRQKILFLSMYLNEDYVTQALSSGALGYIGKDQDVSELVAAIRTVAQGQSYLSPRVSRTFVEDYMRLRKGGVKDVGPLSPISQREREVFDLLLRGHSNEGIAGQLCISRRTVETHRTNMLRKLNLRSLAELFRFAVRHGLFVE